MVVDMKKKTLCKIDLCDRAFFAKEMCNRHYYQVKKHGKVYSTVYDKRPAIIEGGVAKLPLGVEAKDGYAVVDKKYAYLEKYYWYKHSGGYAYSKVDGKLTLLHRLILKYPKSFVDHKDNNRLNNVSSNLRLCTQTQNTGNMSKSKRNTSGYKGVKWHKSNKKWIAEIRGRYIGSYGVIEDAARAYNKEALKTWKHFANINEIVSS